MYAQIALTRAKLCHIVCCRAHAARALLARRFSQCQLLGQQPELGDRYSNNGSLYITSASFLPLGLPETDSYRTAAALNWTHKKAFAGASFPNDYPVTY